MKTLLSEVRGATLVLSLALVPASGVVAQGHKPKHHGTAPGAHPAPKPPPVTPPKLSAVPPREGQAVQAPKVETPAHSVEELVASLRSTRGRLARDDRDDRGHRTRAIRAIDVALELLGTRAGPAIGPGPSPPDKDPKPTALTEKHLDEARELLRGVESRMASDGINAHRFILARDSVQAAIRELNLALVDQ